MRPMSLFERGLAEPTVSLRRLLAGERDVAGETGTTLARYVDEIVTGGQGWPAGHTRHVVAALRRLLASRMTESVQSVLVLTRKECVEADCHAGVDPEVV